MKDVLCSLKHDIKKKRNGQKPILVLLEVTNTQLVLEGPGVSLNRICVERSRYVFVLVKHVWDLSREKGNHYRKDVKTGVIDVHDAKGFFDWNVSTALPQKSGSNSWSSSTILPTLIYLVYIALDLLFKPLKDIMSSTITDRRKPFKREP